MKQIFIFLIFLFSFSNSYANRLKEIEILDAQCSVETQTLGAFKLLYTQNMNQPESIRKGYFGASSKDFYKDIYFSNNRSFYIDATINRKGAYSIELWLDADTPLATQYPGYQILILTLLNGHRPEAGLQKVDVFMSGISLDVGFAGGTAVKTVPLGSGQCDLLAAAIQ